MYFPLYIQTYNQAQTIQLFFNLAENMFLLISILCSAAFLEGLLLCPYFARIPTQVSILTLGGYNAQGRHQELYNLINPHSFFVLCKTVANNKHWYVCIIIIIFMCIMYIIHIHY